MKRDPGALTDRKFDIVVVGGGIYGAATAWEASLRGLSVALIERDDFGSQTSFNNLKTIHGGIRYLQHADLKRMRESIRERRHMMHIAPHLVHPLPFVVPTYEGGLVKSLPAMTAALWLNDIVSWDRNRGAEPGKRLPGGKSLTRDECLELAPGVETAGLTGGVLWYDAQMHNSDRVTLSFVLSASERGALVANHVEATGLMTEGATVVGVRARDRLAGVDGLEIRAKVVVNTTGPWTDRLNPSSRKLFHFSKAMNLVTRPFVEKAAIGVVSRRSHRDDDALVDTGGRFLCLIPWRHVTLVGTSHGHYDGEPDDFGSREEDVRELIDDVNEAYPRAELERSDVRLVHRGLLPRRPSSDASTSAEGVTLQKSYRIEDHAADGLEGLLSVIGVKYTTARDVAEKAVDHAALLIDNDRTPSRSAQTPLVGGDIDDFERFVTTACASPSDGLDADVMRHLALTHGSRYPAVLESGTAERVSPESPVLDAEVRHAVREEMALDLESVVVRRTELGSAGRPTPAAITRCATILREELAWNDAKTKEEIDSVERFYRDRT